MDERTKRVERRLEPWVIGAALLVVPILALEQSEVGQPWSTIATIVNWAIWLVFVIEAVVMLAVVRDRWGWVRKHPLELAIIVLTPPFAPAAIQGLRIVRLLRLLRLLGLVRAARGARRLFTLDGLRWMAVVALILIVGGGMAFVAVENDESLNTWDGLWWAFTTATTVGYGDLFPRTDAGRLIAMAVMVGGIGLVALFTGAIAERFLRVTVDEVVDEVEADDAAILSELTEVRARLASLEVLLRNKGGSQG